MSRQTAMMPIYLEYQGKPVPITECSWLLVAPCGCVAGITVAESLGDGGALTSAEAALAQFTPNKELRRRDVAAGWTARMHGDRATAVAEMVGPNGCPHTPRWGEPPRPDLPGWVWAATRGKPRTHLVPVREDGEYWRTATTLCGSEAYGWRADEWDVSSLPTCRRCERQAAEQSGADLEGEEPESTVVRRSVVTVELPGGDS